MNFALIKGTSKNDNFFIFTIIPFVFYSHFLDKEKLKEAEEMIQRSAIIFNNFKKCYTELPACSSVEYRSITNAICEYQSYKFYLVRYLFINDSLL